MSQEGKTGAASGICILCNSSNTVIQEQLNTDDISTLYKKRAGVSVNRMFHTQQINRCVCRDCGLIFYSPQTIGDGRFYDELQSYPGYYMKEKSEFIEAARWIDDGDEILEIGCGSGHFRNFIHCKSYTGLEFSDKAIEQAKKNNLNVIKQDLKEHAVSHSEKYDVVCYFQVLEHVENPGRFIRNSLSVLKPGGKLILAVPSEDSFIRNASNFYLNMPPHHASRWTDKTLQNIASLNQLKLLSIYHEPLNKEHLLFYSKTKIYTRLIRKTGSEQHSVDLSLYYQILYALSTAWAHIYSLGVKKNKITGQSVLAVYQK